MLNKQLSKMIKSTISFIAVLLLSISITFAQDCLADLKTGGGFEMVNFDGKGKSSGRIVYKIQDVKREGGLTIFTIEFESFNNKDKSEMKNTYKMRCDGNVIMMDASSLINEQQMKSLDGFNMKFTSNDIQFPSNLSVGQKLPDASMKGEGASGPLNVTFNMLIENRQVVSQEKVTVPAGTFDSYKVTSDMVMETKMGMGIKIEMESISYRAPNMLWDIKSESYRKGKLIGRSELSKVF